MLNSITAVIGAMAISLTAANAACTLTEGDEAAVRAAAVEYVDAWLANDEARVMDLLHEDAVLMPARGATPLDTPEAIRAFWFPKDGPTFEITAFSHEISGVEGCDDIAVVRGRQKELDFSFGDDRYRNLGANFVTVYRKRDSEWRIQWRTWNDVGTEKVASDDN
ncbi:MAG: nuclear transport factor 2 family protein [Marinicaulis sp.]|nr:nuclear transport factor 2 family protein [Marinicaulis sp.]